MLTNLAGANWGQPRPVGCQLRSQKTHKAQKTHQAQETHQAQLGPDLGSIHRRGRFRCPSSDEKVGVVGNCSDQWV